MSTVDEDVNIHSEANRLFIKSLPDSTLNKEIRVRLLFFFLFLFCFNFRYILGKGDDIVLARKVVWLATSRIADQTALSLSGEVSYQLWRLKSEEPR